MGCIGGRWVDGWDALSSFILVPAAKEQSCPGLGSKWSSGSASGVAHLFSIGCRKGSLNGSGVEGSEEGVLAGGRAAARGLLRGKGGLGAAHPPSFPPSGVLLIETERER